MDAISSDDLLRIKASVAKVKTKDERAVNKATELKQKSDQRVAGWKDTLASKRKARLDWKAKKEEEEEEKRKKIDAEEAMIRQRQREETIKRANDLLYEGDDKVKFLRSQQLYTDVVADRERQIAEQLSIKSKITAEEARWHEVAMEKIHTAEKEEAERNILRRKKAKEVGLELYQQKLVAQSEEARQLREQKEEEGAMMEKIKLEDRVAEENAKHLSVARRQKAKAEMEQIALDAKLANAKKIQEEKEDARLRKEQLADMQYIANARAALEKKHFEERQAVRRKLSERAAQDLEERSAREVELFLKHQKAQNKKYQERQEMEARAKRELRDSVNKSREDQMRRQQEEREAEARESACLAQYCRKMNEEQLERERRAEQERRSRNAEIRKIQEQQCVENKMRREREEMDRLKREREVIAELDRQDDLFLDFAQKEVDRFRAHGKKTILLERAMNAR